MKKTHGTGLLLFLIVWIGEKMSEFDVEIKNIVKRFGSFVALDDVSIDIKKGEFISLLGPSGCGKTTLLRILSGFEQPTEGELRITGKNMATVTPNKRPTNLVFQHLALFPHLTVAKNISFGLDVKKFDKAEIQKRVDEMLALVQLEGFGERKISETSGGQKQRVAIARALINRPAVLLLDEPLSALDLKLREQMQIELKRIQREVGATFIYVTHDQGEAITMSDRIAVIKDGVIEQLDTPNAIYERPKTKFVASFIGQTNLIEGVVKSKKGSEVQIETSSGHTLLVSNAEHKDVGETALLSLRPEKIMVGPDVAEDNSFEGTIADVTYKGGNTRYYIEVGNGWRLEVNVQHAANATVSSVGDKTRVGWSSSRAFIIGGE